MKKLLFTIVWSFILFVVASPAHAQRPALLSESLAAGAAAKTASGNAFFETSLPSVSTGRQWTTPLALQLNKSEFDEGDVLQASVMVFFGRSSNIF